MSIKVRSRLPLATYRAEEVIKESDDHFIVSVKQKAERNMANKRVIEIFKGEYPGKHVHIVSGHQSPSKILGID